jgi:hypothetical protein
MDISFGRESAQAEFKISVCLLGHDILFPFNRASLAADTFTWIRLCSTKKEGISKIKVLSRRIRMISGKILFHEFWPRNCPAAHCFATSYQQTYFN